MKLLFFIFSLSGGGAERVTVNLANYWARKGWQITIVTLAPVTQDTYPLLPAIRRISLDLAGFSKNIAEGLSRNFSRVRALRQVLLETRPDVALAMMDNSCVTLALAAQGLSGIVRTGSIRVHPPSLPTKPIWRRIQSISYGRLSAVVALTETTAAWLAENTNARRIEIIPNPIEWPLPEGGPRVEPETIGLPGGRKVLLAAGRLAPQKGFDLLIDAFSGLAERHPDWDLVILGEGPERQRLAARISGKKLGQRVFLPGRAGNMADWYKRSNLYALSSRFEGFPNTLAEAMAHGLPAISFDCDTGPRNIIRSGTDGLLAPPEDVPALAAALSQLMEDRDTRLNFGIAAQETRRRYSLETVARIWEALFEKLLSQELKQHRRKAA